MQFHFLRVLLVLVLFICTSASDATTKQLRSHTGSDSAKVLLGAEANEVHATPGTLASKELHLPGAAVHFPLMVQDPELHTGERTFWPPDQGNGLAAWLFATLFVIIIAMTPCILHVAGEGWGFPGCTVIAEGLCLVVWLITGLFMFTHVFYFSSPHFGDAQRTLTLVEAVYLFAQIITTVGYGDIIPAFLGGQIFVGFFVFCAIMLIAGMVSEISAMIIERAEDRIALAVEETSKHLREHDTDNVQLGHEAGPSFKPVFISLCIFAVCVLAGCLFYSLYPGEGKTFGQALYMSIITLTTVGFGAFTAETEGGKVFGAFWMLVGVAALGGVVASFTEFVVGMKDKERPSKKENDAEDFLNEELKDHRGRVDKLHYLQYALLKYSIASKHEVEAILKQFDALDESKVGSISVEKLQTLSSSLATRRQSLVGREPLGQSHDLHHHHHGQLHASPLHIHDHHDHQHH
jgi:voltage-gated potassium channel Kch